MCHLLHIRVSLCFSMSCVIASPSFIHVSSRVLTAIVSKKRSILFELIESLLRRPVPKAPESFRDGSYRDSSQRHPNVFYAKPSSQRHPGLKRHLCCGNARILKNRKKQLLYFYFIKILSKFTQYIE